MAGLFDLLNTVIGKITQNSVTYATAPTPPVGDDSTKVATTAFVVDKTAVIPSGNVAVWGRGFTVNKASNLVYLYAPAGGTWFCWGSIKYGTDNSGGNTDTWTSEGIAISGGGRLCNFSPNYIPSSIVPKIYTNNGMALKIA